MNQEPGENESVDRHSRWIFCSFRLQLDFPPAFSRKDDAFRIGAGNPNETKEGEVIWIAIFPFTEKIHGDRVGEVGDFC